jgi:hypothetical protein
MCFHILITRVIKVKLNYIDTYILLDLIVKPNSTKVEFMKVVMEECPVDGEHDVQ